MKIIFLSLLFLFCAGLSGCMEPCKACKYMDFTPEHYTLANMPETPEQSI